MDYKFNEEHLDLVKEQVWECKDDTSIYGLLSEFELEQFEDHLPADASRILEMGAGMGRGSIQLAEMYPNAEFTLADRQGRTENKGIFYPADDEFYNDFEMTRSFCSLNALEEINTFDVEVDDWKSLPKFDLITSRCAVGFHSPIERYIDRLVEVSAPEVVMIFGTNYIYEYPERYNDIFKEVIVVEGKRDPRFPFQNWLILKGIK